MKFKTDENVHPDLVARLRSDGHDTLTVWDEEMRGAPDADIATACRTENRCLITFDKGFGDIRTYPPADYGGIIVLRLERQSRSCLLAAWARVAEVLAAEPLVGRLWIVDDHGVRIRRSDADDAP